jgi:hypothetical protein
MRDLLLHQPQMLAARLSHLCIGPDLAALSVADLIAVCSYMRRLADG